MVSLWAAVKCYSEGNRVCKFVSDYDKTVQKISSFNTHHRGDNGALFVEENGRYGIFHRLYSSGVQDEIRIDFDGGLWHAVGCDHDHIYYSRNSSVDIMSVDDNRSSILFYTSREVWCVVPSYDNETVVVEYCYQTDAHIVDVHSGRSIHCLDNVRMPDTVPMYKNTWLVWNGHNLHILDTRSDSTTFLMKHTGQTRVLTYYESLNALGVSTEIQTGFAHRPIEYGLLDIRNLADYTLVIGQWGMHMYMSF